MDAKTIIEIAGGRKAVIEMTGLTRGRISQWVVDNNIPTPWMKFFQEKFPKIREPIPADRRHNPQSPEQKRGTESSFGRQPPAAIEKVTT